LRREREQAFDFRGVEIEQQLPRHRLHLRSVHLNRQAAAVGEDFELLQWIGNAVQLLPETRQNHANPLGPDPLAPQFFQRPQRHQVPETIPLEPRDEAVLLPLRQGPFLQGKQAANFVSIVRALRRLLGHGRDCSTRPSTLVYATHRHFAPPRLTPRP
jgi:hypothetical protein